MAVGRLRRVGRATPNVTEVPRVSSLQVFMNPRRYRALRDWVLDVACITLGATIGSGAVIAVLVMMVQYR